MITGETFLALLPELVATGFLILVLMVGVFAERNIGLVAGLAALGSLAVFGARLCCSRSASRAASSGAGTW